MPYRCPTVADNAYNHILYCVVFARAASHCCLLRATLAGLDSCAIGLSRSPSIRLSWSQSSSVFPCPFPFLFFLSFFSFLSFFAFFSPRSFLSFSFFFSFFAFGSSSGGGDSNGFEPNRFESAPNQIGFAQNQFEPDSNQNESNSNQSGNQFDSWRSQSAMLGGSKHRARRALLHAVRFCIVPS